MPPASGRTTASNIFAWPNRARCLAALALAACGVAAAAQAQAQTLSEEAADAQGLAQPSAGSGWSATLGVGLDDRARYPGASARRLRPVPLVSVNYDNRIFLSPLGLGVAVIDADGFRAGPILGYEGGRDRDNIPQLAGLGDIPASLTAGGFASYRTGNFEISATVRQAVTHDSNGLTGLAQMSYRFKLVPKRLDFLVGPEISFADSKHEQTWFGVTAAQSAASGLPVYSPGGGVKDAGLRAVLLAHASDHVLLRAFAEVATLTGDAAKAPIVRAKTQDQFGVGVAYHF